MSTTCDTISQGFGKTKLLQNEGGYVPNPTTMAEIKKIVKTRTERGGRVKTGNVYSYGSRFRRRTIRDEGGWFETLKTLSIDERRLVPEQNLEI